MTAIRFILFIIPIGFWSVSDSHRDHCRMRLSEARRRKFKARKWVGEWYLIAGLKKDLKNRTD